MGRVSKADRLSQTRRTHLGRALARARWVFEDEFQRRIVARGFDDYRPSDSDIIARLPMEGARITTLAQRSRVTKQAVGKLVRGLEERGYVQRAPDPDDGRAFKVVLTRRGRALLEAALEEITAIEAQWEEVLTPRALKRLKGLLFEVSDELGPEDYL